MRTTTYILALCLLMSCRSYGQLVITDSASTASICFNDGTITVKASGGAGIYTFYIIGGPSYPNITYPMTLPHLDSVFLTLPRGQYTIMVIDGSRDTAYATSTVSGTYTFPVINPPPPNVVDSSCITVYAQGGRPPYQFAISSVGTNSGFGPYQSSGTFCHLCDGTYWIRVMDSCSNIFTTNRINVVVPVPQYIVSHSTTGNVDNIFVGESVPGAAPYTFHLQSGSISITNHTGIFSIPVRCPPDTLTATDSCGRVFTSILNLHPLLVSVYSPCNSGTAIMTIDSAAIAPFTITGSNGSLITHLRQITFTGLPTTGPLNFSITDSCGNHLSLVINCTQDTNPFFNVCPFDSSIHMKPNLLPLCYPAVITCINCSPVQKDTIYNNATIRLFTNIDTGVLYMIRVQDTCGRNDTFSFTPNFIAIGMGDSIISCRDFTVFTNPHVVYTPPTLYTVFDQGVFVDSSSAFQPYFYHMPPGYYQVTASQPMCRNATVTIALPGLRGACLVPMFDSSCTRSYAIYQSISTTRETYSLINTITSATYLQHIPSPYSNAVVFTGVPVGTYNLMSDSGCSVPFALPSFSHTVSAISTRQCTGQALITATVTPPILNCNTAQGGYITLLKDNQYIYGQSIGQGSTVQFAVSDTGYYVVRLYLSNTSDFTLPTPYDTICPLDTTLVYVNDNVVPNIIASQVILVCGNVTANIPYSIFGGTAPYTVQILGYPTRHVISTRDTFPNVAVGVYTMIVSDSCGISRSFSVSVIDTCSNVCTTHSRFTVDMDCANGIIYLQNQSTAATHYQWYINGSLYAYGSDTSFFGTSGTSYTVKLYAFRGICVDSFTVTFIDTCPPICTIRSQFSISDSVMCTQGIIILHNQSARATSYKWYVNGLLYSFAADTSLRVLAGSYTIRLYAYSGLCEDSFTVTFTDTCTPNCWVHSRFTLNDTLTCVHAIVSMQNQSSGATSGYQWDINGQVYAYATDTSFTATSSGAYIIKLYADSTSCVDSMTKTIIVQDSLHNTARFDTSLCGPISLILNSHMPNTVWSNGTADSILNVSGPGLYQANVSNACGSIYDTTNVILYPAISGFDLTDSKTTICEEFADSTILRAAIDSPQRSVVFVWNNGVRDSSAYSSSIVVYQAGNYTVTADNGFCPLIKAVSIAEISCDSECLSGLAIPDIFSPNGDHRNDTFYLPHICDMIPFAMHIYNEWGELVFESQDINQGWDGYYKGKEQPEGVYWLWLMLTPGKTTIYKSGTVTLVR